MSDSGKLAGDPLTVIEWKTFEQCISRDKIYVPPHRRANALRDRIRLGTSIARAFARSNSSRQPQHPSIGHRRGIMAL